MCINGIGGKLYDNNSFNRGALAPASQTIFEPGTRAAKNLSDVTMVSDQFILQGNAYLVDATAEESHAFQPQIGLGFQGEKHRQQSAICLV